MSDNVAPVDTTAVPPEQGSPAAEPQTPPAAAPAEHEGLSTAPEVQPAATPAEHEGLPIASEAPPVATPAEHEAPPVAQAAQASAAKPAMSHVLGEDYSYQQSKRGEIRQGRIIAIKDEGIVVDLGLKREGFIPQDDLRQVGAEPVSQLHEGDEISVYVLRPENDREGNVLVSWHRARQEQDWIDAQRLHDTAEVWEGRVKGYNRGGLIVPYGKIRGFVPASQITGVSRRLDSASLQARLAEMVGQDLPLKVIEVDRENRRLILSERTARREWRAKQREKLLNELQEGDIVPGVVRNICDFGIFVDLGGTDGLVHVSELSWRRTNHPSEVVQVGDKVQAYVLRVDRENRRIGLSLRLASPDPWSTVEEKYHVGEVVTGTITKLIAFGAFAALDDGIEGLIHISELSDIPPRHPSEIVSQDEVLPLCIVKIDAQRRRMGLSVRRITEEQRAEWDASHQPPAPEEEAELVPEPPPEEPPVEPPMEQRESEVQATEAPAEGPVEEPVGEPHVEEAPVEEPVGELQVEEPPVEGPVGEAQVEEPPLEEPVGELQVEEPPVEGLVGEAQVEEPPLEEPAGELQVEEPPVEGPVGEAQVEEPPPEEPAGELQVEEPPVEGPVGEAQVEEPPLEEPVSGAQLEEPPIDETETEPEAGEAVPLTPPDELLAEGPVAEEDL
jgi:small subunit ribosomal protein S1